MFELGDIVYYINSNSPEPIGEIVGIRETTWSNNQGRDIIYKIQTWRGSIRNIYDENSITNKRPGGEPKVVN